MNENHLSHAFSSTENIVIAAVTVPSTSPHAVWDNTGTVHFSDPLSVAPNYSCVRRKLHTKAAGSSPQRGPVEGRTGRGAPPGICAGCGQTISARYFLHAADRKWHTRCLTCIDCHFRLDSRVTCYSRDGHIYCREDYFRWVVLRVSGMNVVMVRMLTIAEGQTTEGQTIEGQTAEGQTTEGHTTEGQTAEGKILKDRLLKDRLLKDRLLKDRLLKNRLLKNRLLKDRLQKDRRLKDRLLKDRLLKDRLQKDY
ncbi:hypothetical protein ACOMHN_001899 [Nucella lapillus]